MTHDKPMILIINSNADEAELLHDLLADTYSVMVIYTVEEALMMFEILHLKTHVVLISSTLSDSTVLDALHAFRNISLIPEFIVYSNQPMSAALEAGAFDTLSFPVDPEELCHSVKRAVENIRYLNALQAISQKIFLDQYDIIFQLEALHQLQLEKRTQGDILTVDDMVTLFPAFVENKIGSLELLQKDCLAYIQENLSKPESSNVLIVAEDGDDCQALLQLVSKRYHTRVVSSGESALSLLSKDEPFDVVLVDTRLPDMTGLSFCQALDGETLSCDIVLLATSSEINIAKHALNHGALDFILKPFQPIDVVSTLATSLQHRYIQKAMTFLSSQFSDSGLPQHIRLSMLNHLAHTKMRENRPIVMGDVYVFFPELRSSQMDESTVVPKSVIEEEGISGFIDSLGPQQTKRVF